LSANTKPRNIITKAVAKRKVADRRNIISLAGKLAFIFQSRPIFSSFEKFNGQI
jgi:hypothetical protein